MTVKLRNREVLAKVETLNQFKTDIYTDFSIK